ncbi:MAG: DNA polymerase III subunit delta [bacterium]|nr:DNA polymerase III subunit delta [bacterium]
MKRARGSGHLTPAAVVEQVRRGNVLSVYVLTGENTLGQEQVVRALREAVLTAETEEFNYEVLDAEREGVTSGEIIAAMETVPFLGGVRLVVVKHADALPASELEVVGEHVVVLLEQARKDVVVVLMCGELDKRTRFARQMGASGVVVECAPEEGCDPVEAARVHFGKRMTNGAAALLRELSGGDARALGLEVEKVCMYVGERGQVEEEDVMAVCVDTAMRNEWEVADRLLRGEVGKALVALQELRAGGMDAVYECTIVASALSRLPAACAAAREGTLYQRWGEFRLSYSNPAHRAVEERLRQIRDERLARTLRWLMYVDIAVKGTNVPGAILADMTCVHVA